MQSGSDRVLAAMRRHYRIETFLGKLDRARELVGGLNLTSDVIVGHPAEDEQAFEETLDAVARGGLHHGAHVFPYSPRPGTADAGTTRSLRRTSGAGRSACGRCPMRRGRPGGPRCSASRARCWPRSRRGRGYAADYTPFVVAGAAPGRVVEVVPRAGDDHLIGTLAA